MRTQEQVNEIVRLLLAEYPEADCTLDWRKDYELLFSVRLAAQCTDERVNKISPALFERFPTLEAFARADVGEVEEYVRSCGFFRSKARDIVECANVLLEKHGGKLPLHHGGADGPARRGQEDRKPHSGGRVQGPRLHGGGYPLHPHLQPPGPGGQSERPGEDRDGA